MQIALIGDIALHGLIREDPLKNEERFSQISAVLENMDCVIANLETPIELNKKKDTFKQEKKGIIIGTNEQILLDVSKVLNLKAVSLANNHILDYGFEGLSATLNCLEKNEIQTTGISLIEFKIPPVVFDITGKKIAFFAYVDKSTNPNFKPESENYINWFEANRVLRDIEPYKNSHLVIVSVHWGEDYSHFYTSAQQKTARFLIDNGVDVIMGHHPHTVQAYEIYKGKPIFYSLGSLCFGDFLFRGTRRALKRKTKWSFIPVLNEKGELLKIIPTREMKGNYLKVLKNERQFHRKMKFLSYLNKKKLNSGILSKLIFLKEKYYDRFAEGLFGYYRNPYSAFLSMLKPQNRSL